MAQNHPHTLEYKVLLLKYLLGTTEWFTDPNPDRFWQFIGDTFTGSRVPKGAPKMTGKELEKFCDGEAAIWNDEKGTPKKKRRKGYETGSEYDELMSQWMDVWIKMAVTHWQTEMERPGATYHKWNMVPTAYRPKVKDAVEEKIRKYQVQKAEERAKAEKEAQRAAEKAASAKKPSSKAPSQSKKDEVSRTEDPRFEYDGEKLKKVVEAARARACEVGKYDLAAAVHRIYQDALVDMKLRVLLEAILTQCATKAQNDQFQEYVRKAKKKLKDIKSEDLRIRATTSIQEVAADPPYPNGVRFRPVQTTENDADDRSTDAAVDSAYASGRGSDKSVGDDATPVPGGQEARKRRRESTTSTEAAQADLEEAERAAKRRRGEDVEDDSGSYYPNRRANIAKARKKRSMRGRDEDEDEDEDDESSELSEAGDTDIEAAKEAYVDEMVRRKSAEASRQAIEDQYGPVSPTVADDASWKSMPSPTLHSTQAERNSTQEQARAGAENNNTRASQALANVPAPPPGEPPAGLTGEQLTPAESSHAFQIISGAAAEAVQPAISRLEGKIDSLLSNRVPQLPLLEGITSGTKGPECANPSRELVNIEELLKSAELDAANPEIAKLVTQMARNAAEASIHAAEAARRAGEMARDVSLVLLQLGAKKNGDAGPSNTQGQRK